MHPRAQGLAPAGGEAEEPGDCIDGGTGGGGGPPDIGDGPERHGAATRQGAGPLGGEYGKRGGAAIDRQQNEGEEMRRVDAAAPFTRPAGDSDRMPCPDQ